MRWVFLWPFWKLERDCLGRNTWIRWWQLVALDTHMQENDNGMLPSDTK